ncbi:MAG TPA: dTMP kinase [Gemmatimonadales bacterium]|jgi:dTMP kinase
MSAGFFLVLEGPEAAGKSTLARALVQRFEAQGEPPLLVREPGGTPVAEALRKELLDAERNFAPEMELLYMTTARADLVARVIRPALAAGRVVISDRYDLSTLAYQGAGRGLPPEQVRWVNRAATGGLLPDLTLVLDVDPALARARQVSAGKGLDRMEREPADFHARVAAAYRQASGPGIHHIAADSSMDQVLDAAWPVVVKARAATVTSSGVR